MEQRIFICFVFNFLLLEFSWGQPGTVTLTNLDPENIEYLNYLNSDYRETNPCLTPDGRYLFFMSGRGGQSWNNPEYTSFNGKTEADGDLYYSRLTEGTWSKPVNLGPTINTSMGEDEPNVSPDGQFVIFQSWKEGWDTSGGPYYRAELLGNVWGKPKGLGGNIHLFFLDQIKKNNWYYATDGSSLSPDGRIFVFAAGKWYDQPMDLYISFYDSGIWTYPKKMVLNTLSDERSVFIAADSRTLFFSSSGYGGSGGLDIFKTIIDLDGKPEPIINLGPVFNTEENDFGFTMNIDGTDVYYTRNADIVHVKLKNPDRLLKPLPSLLINGMVTDYYGHPVEADIRILREQNLKQVAMAKSNALSGEYSIVIRKADQRYVKEITAPGFKDISEIIDIGDPEKSSRMESRDLLKKSNSELIFFDLDDSGIRDSEIPKMDSIITYLFNHKKSEVRLTGHADQLGTDQYNLELSRKRVEKVKSYFENKGIPSRIMETQYFGESQPLESHPRGEESQINRRVEVLIVPLR